MHELGLMEDLVGCVERDLEGVRVLVVRLEVGSRSGVAPDALRFCFDVCTHGTNLEGAALDIVETGDDRLTLREVEVSECAQPVGAATT